MKIFKLLFLITLVVLCQVIHTKAQILDEAIMLNPSRRASTARIQALAGAGVALGGDLGVSSINPAGLAMIKKSKVLGTPSLRFSEIGTTFNREQNNNQLTTNIGFDQLGTAFVAGGNTRGIRNNVFALNYQKQNIFKREFTYGNSNSYRNELLSKNEDIPNLSIVDYFRSLAYKVPENTLINEKTTALDAAAFDIYLIDPIFDTDNNQFSDYGTSINGIPLQKEKYSATGRLNQFDFSYAGNYENKLFFGLSLSFPTFESTIKRDFTENNYLLPQRKTAPDGTESIIYVEDQGISAVRLNQETKLSGSGFNASFGLLYKINKYIRLGINYKTPTFYTIDREYFFDLFSDNTGRQALIENKLTTLENGMVQSDILKSKYTLTVPSSINFGASIFAGKYGFITFEAERINHNKLKVQSEDFNVLEDNRALVNTYKEAWNLKVGAEAKLDSFYLRAGYAHNGDPHKAENIDLSTQNLSFGIGYGWGDWNVDLSITQTSFKDNISPYVHPDNEFSRDLDGDPDTIDPLISPNASIMGNNVNVGITVTYSY